MTATFEALYNLVGATMCFHYAISRVHWVAQYCIAEVLKQPYALRSGLDRTRPKGVNGVKGVKGVKR